MKKRSAVSPLKTQPLPVAGTGLLSHMFDRALLAMGLVGILAALLGFTVLAWQTKLTGTTPSPWPITILTIVYGVTLAWYWKKKLSVELENYSLGRKGEVVVGHLLEGLRPYGYTPIHDVLCGEVKGKQFNIDHVLIGPKGVFAIETKTWRKENSLKEEIMYRNNSIYTGPRRRGREAVDEARRHASWLSTLLTHRIGKTQTVTPILTFPGWWVDERATDEVKRNDNVLMLNPKAIGKYLASYETILSDSEIEQIVKVISNYVYEQAEREEREQR